MVLGFPATAVPATGTQQFAPGAEHSNQPRYSSVDRPKRKEEDPYFNFLVMNQYFPAPARQNIESRPSKSKGRGSAFDLSDKE